jgi:hypothetical protein
MVFWKWDQLRDTVKDLMIFPRKKRRRFDDLDCCLLPFAMKFVPISQKCTHASASSGFKP